MTQETKNHPAAKIRDGSIEAAIWANAKKQGEGVRYSVTYTRSYKTEDGWKESNAFSEIDSLRLARLITKSLNKIDDLKKIASWEEGGQ